MRFAAVNIADVQLDDRPWEHLERIENCNRSERIGGRINDNAVGSIDGLLYPIHELGFTVSLPKLNRITLRLALQLASTSAKVVLP